MAKESYEIERKSKDGSVYVYDFVVDRFSKDTWDVDSCILFIESGKDMSCVGPVKMDIIPEDILRKLEEKIWEVKEDWAI